MVWGHPGRARVAVAGVVLAAVAGGAFVALHPYDASEGRQRHRQYAGATEADGDEDVSPDGPTAPGGDPTSPTGAPTGSPGTSSTAAGSATTAGGAANGTGDSGAGNPGSSSSTNGGTGGSSTSHSGATTRPSGPTGTDRSGTPATAKAGADGWSVLPAAPIGPRSGHTAVWTGREMVIWGGLKDYDSDPFTDGAAYDPAARTWRKLPAAPLSPRFDPQAWWTGQEMLLFGGVSVDSDVLADGALWNPATNSWRAIPAAPMGPRDGAVVAWAGDRLVVWSGNNVPGSDADATDSSGDTPEPPGPVEVKNDGAAYVPATGSWVPIGPAPIPPRSGAQSAWTGSRLVVTGGDGEDDERTDGAAFDPVSGAWAPIAVRPEPGSCGGAVACTGVWTGTAVLFPASGLAYDPAADRWSAMAPAPGTQAPAPGEPAAWTGRYLLTWGVAGGDDASGADTGDSGDDSIPAAAAMYDPAANRWQPLPTGPLQGRTSHTAVWAGEAMLVWGGQADLDTFLADGAAYQPE